MNAPSAPGAADDDVPVDIASDIVRVIRGEPDEMELAALVAGIFAAASSLGSAEPEDLEPAPWTDAARRLGMPSRPGRHTWRWSLHP